MPTYLKWKLCADQFGGITTEVQQILTTFFLQTSFHSNIYSNCWRIRVFAWRQERWRKLKSSTSGYSRYRIMLLIFQCFCNWPHSFKQMYKILQIWKGCWHLACRGTFLHGLWVSTSNTARVLSRLAFQTENIWHNILLWYWRKHGHLFNIDTRQIYNYISYKSF